ncbi:hypothetical protein AX14_013840 [Amanita brunnescens Koide BX004]|nr:hypothetical protein AX14_013840 [Amanita brunnescens Koide BX004]
MYEVHRFPAIVGFEDYVLPVVMNLVDGSASPYPSFCPQNYRLATSASDPSSGTCRVVPCQYEDATKRSVPTLDYLLLLPIRILPVRVVLAPLAPDGLRDRSHA